MKSRILASLLVILIAVLLLGAQTTLRGTWSANLSGADNWIQVSFQDADGGHHSSSFDLNRAKVTLGDKQGPVQFTVTRDAGTFVFNGSVQGELASGFVGFSANPQYTADMSALGYPNITERQLFRMAMVDVTRKFASDLNSAGYSKLGIDQLIRMSIHGADAAFIRNMAYAGYKNLSTEDLVRMRIHDVTPEFVHLMAANGFTNLDGEQLVRMKIHDVDPEFVKAVRQAGFTNIDGEELVRMKTHNVSPEFITKVKQLGYNDVTPEQIIQLSIHDVSADYISQAKSAQQDIRLDEIIRIKIHGGRRARL